DGVAVATGRTCLAGGEELHVVAEGDVVAPRALRTPGGALLGALQQHAHRLAVDLGDDVGPARHLRVVPAEVIETIEVELGEVRGQGERTDLLAGGVAEGGADGALVDGTHEEMLSGRSRRSRRKRTADDGGKESGILRPDARVRRFSGDGSSAAGSLSASAVGARRTDDHLSRH